MSRTMSRWVFVGAVALAVIGTAGSIVPGAATAEAAPNNAPNPFAGTYLGLIAGSHQGWQVSISSNGDVSGSGVGYYGVFGTGSLSGTISSAGRLSLGGKETVTFLPGPDCSGSCSATTVKNSFRVRATAVADAAGDLTCTTSSGQTFTWNRQ